MNVHLTVAISALGLSLAGAQVINNFEGATVGALEYGFRAPRNSGSTSANLQAQSTPNTNNVSAVLAGFDSNSSQLLDVRFNFVDSSPNRWVRLTTSGAGGFPNPAVPLDQRISFDVYSVQPIKIALGIRETGGSGPVGANGGGTGTIEWVGAEQAAGSGSVDPGGKLVTAGSWQTLSFDLGVDPTFAFTGNGTLTGSWGVLESLAISSEGQTDQHIYLDNFRVTPIPEPSATTFLMIGGAIFAAIAMRRKR